MLPLENFFHSKFSSEKNISKTRKIQFQTAWNEINEAKAWEYIKKKMFRQFPPVDSLTEWWSRIQKSIFLKFQYLW